MLTKLLIKAGIESMIGCERAKQKVNDKEFVKKAVITAGVCTAGAIACSEIKNLCEGNSFSEGFIGRIAKALKDEKPVLAPTMEQDLVQFLYDPFIHMTMGYDWFLDFEGNIDIELIRDMRRSYIEGAWRAEGLPQGSLLY